MITINEAKRLVKRVLLTNIVTEKKNLSITPLISGKHGIGKSAMIKSIADDLGGVCITIEGGTLKEGEITGIPYQYKDETGKVKFRFLPYYAVDRIQSEEKRIYEASHESMPEIDFLNGDENVYRMNSLTPEEKVEAIKSGKVKLVIIFIDEINRTENSVYKELMNILLTRTVNGYEFPWWVLFVGAMNPSTQNSVYATNEMDPAQLDRFLKLRVKESVEEWLDFGAKSGMSDEILDFIKGNPKVLSEQEKNLDDEEKPTPSPRGWDMVDSLLKGKEYVNQFLSEDEAEESMVVKDIQTLIAAKLGDVVATMFMTSKAKKETAISPEELLADDENLSRIGQRYLHLSASKKIQTNDQLLDYLVENIEFMMLNPEAFEVMKKQIGALVRNMDASTKLLFAQKVVSSSTNEGNSLLELLHDVFEQDMIDMLDLSDDTRKRIKKEK